MNRILDFALKPDQAALWFIGQAGFIIRSREKTLIIDPYLSDSCGRAEPAMARQTPVPMKPGELKVDIFVITHDHQDHLDPETIEPYQYKEKTVFVAPRLACRRLISLGIPERNVRRIDSGEADVVEGVSLTGVYTIPNSPDAVDTAGYFVQFDNGRSLYHTGDTDLSDVLLACAPSCEVLLPCINGKWGNLDVMQAAKLAAKIRPRFAIPHHYDVMAVNSENPEAFPFFLRQEAPEAQIETRILKVMEPFVWGAP